ncbi:hypothetical protein Z945_409 [Sulfitobacter noctilucae]|nr:hypothetical protein Z945_409 [Sulfitobacter noctilucae]
MGNVTCGEWGMLGALPSRAHPVDAPAGPPRFCFAKALG